MERFDLKGGEWVGWAVYVSLALLPGCLAQQADLTQVERKLEARITGLDQQEKKLNEAVKQAGQAKAELDQKVAETRARLSQQLTDLQETDLPSIRGETDKNTHQIGLLRNRLEDTEQQTVGRLTKIEKAQTDQAALIKADRDQMREELGKVSVRLDATSALIVSLAKKVDARLEEHDKAIGGEASQARSLTDQMMQLNHSLVEFKQALKTFGDRLVQQEERMQELAAASSQSSQRTEALSAKVEADAQATTAHLAEVNRSVGSVAKAVETIGERLMARAEQQDRRLDEMAKTVQAVTIEGAVFSQTTTGNRRTRGAAKGSLPPGQGGQQELTSRQAQPESPGSADSAALAAVPATTGSTMTAVQPAAELSDENVKETYEKVLRTFKQGDLDGALRGFSGFLAQYPTSELAPNAQYWLGESYYGKKDYERAIEAFDRVKAVYPASEKVAAALLKKSFAYLALNDRKRAVVTLRQVVEGYPKSPEAEKALDKLAQLKHTR